MTTGTTTPGPCREGMPVVRFLGAVTNATAEKLLGKTPFGMDQTRCSAWCVLASPPLSMQLLRK